MTYTQTMTDVAYDCLSKRKKEIEFVKLWAEVAKTMKIPDDRLKRKKAQFYSELMLDSRFASLENNKWDLRNRRKFEEVHVSTEDIDIDEDEEEEEQLDRSGLDIPTGDDAYDN
jgi:DNA-directed RNA polymerase subunit delta